MRHTIISRYSISLKYKTSNVRSLSVKYCDVHPQNPSKQNKITSMFLPLASVTSRSPFSANLMVASCEREIPDKHFFLLLLRPFPICYHYQECPGIRQTKKFQKWVKSSLPKISKTSQLTNFKASINLTNSLNSSMAPWLHGSMAWSLQVWMVANSQCPHLNLLCT